jgi:RarD protein
LAEPLALERSPDGGAAGLRRRGQALAILAVLAWSTAGPLQRELDCGVLVQMGGRAVVGGLALLALVALREGRRTWAAITGLDAAGWQVAACVAGAQATFIVALNHTTVAEVLLFQAIAPLVAAVLAVAFLHERVSRRSWLAMGVALAGVVTMVGGAQPTLLGDGAAAAMSTCFAVMIVLTRRHRTVSMTPAVCVAQFAMAAGVLLLLPFANPGRASASDALWITALGIVQVGVGFGAFTAAARLLPVTQMALITLVEVVLGPLWVALSVGENPGFATLVGGAIVIGAVALDATTTPQPPARV